MFKSAICYSLILPIHPKVVNLRPLLYLDFLFVDNTLQEFLLLAPALKGEHWGLNMQFLIYRYYQFIKRLLTSSVTCPGPKGWTLRFKSVFRYSQILPIHKKVVNLRTLLSLDFLFYDNTLQVFLLFAPALKGEHCV